MAAACGRLLISVRSLAEARIALEGGASIIDLKEPAHGPLGPVAPEVRHEVAAFERADRTTGSMFPRRDFSLALGELCDWCGEEIDSLDVYKALKLGLAGMAGQRDWPELWRAAMECRGASVDRVLVACADAESCAAPTPEEVLEAAVETGCNSVMLDTFQKSGRSSLKCLGPARLRKFVASAGAQNLPVALAGSLGLNDIPFLMALGPRILGFRGAACVGGREGQLSVQKIRCLENAISNEVWPVASAKSSR
jgi:(5-formylfuran-3-yl)methyl phosphate synthase